MSIEYARLYPELTRVLEEAGALCSKEHPRPAPTWAPLLDECRTRLTNAGSLRVVLVGEFNAGKSSLIKALTGVEDIVIDADVATAVANEYPWRGVTLVDTPGVQAEVTSTDHDAISRSATIGADLVLFVITNELFNPRLAKYLQFVVGPEGLGLARKTAIVVNKIDREQNSDEVLISEVARVLGGTHDVPVWLCSTGKYLDAQKYPAERRERVLRQSRLDELIERIDAFVRDSGATGRLATPLQVVADVLEQAQGELAESGDDRKQLELLRRQKRVVSDLAVQLTEARKLAKKKAYSAVLSQADSAVAEVTTATTGEDLASLFESGLASASADVEAARDGLSADMMGAFAEAQQKLSELGESPLAHEVTRIEAKKAGKVEVEEVKKKGGDDPSAMKFVKSGFPQIEKALKGLASDRSFLKETYYKVGKALGHKFRPWEALKGAGKLAKLAGGLGKAVPFLAFAADAYIGYREEKANDERERHLANMRIALRKSFIDQARVEAETLEKAGAELVTGPLAKAIHSLDEQAAAIAAAGTTRKDVAERLARLKSDCVSLRSRIYSENT